MDIGQRICKRIRELRKSHKLTQTELGERINLTQQTINKYEKKIPPDILTLKDICDVFNITLTDFFRDIECEPDLSAEARQIIELVKSLTPDKLNILKSVIVTWINKS